MSSASGRMVKSHRALPCIQPAFRENGVKTVVPTTLARFLGERGLSKLAGDELGRGEQPGVCSCEEKRGQPASIFGTGEGDHDAIVGIPWATEVMRDQSCSVDP